MNGYGNYGQVWDIPSQLLQNGTLSNYTPCTSCAGFGGFGNLKKAAVRWRKRGQHLPQCIGKVRSLRQRLKRCKARCPKAAGFGADWEDVDESIKELYLDGIGGLGMGLGTLPKWALPVAAVAAFMWWRNR